nr:hypothetical protein [Pectobacterium carotovorum]
MRSKPTKPTAIPATACRRILHDSPNGGQADPARQHPLPVRQSRTADTQAGGSAGLPTAGLALPLGQP